MADRRTRKVRHQQKQVLQFGQKSKRSHKRLGGRTGSIQRKKFASRRTR